ncbi:MAG TPA: aldo/keto reductase [Plantibacter sp.]|uniref:aldo/keto reductase n=1 Tax=unclassified Plantibacter TaxID=2624265 RepID=UPI002CC2CB56|nr:aldo/keto reductase [Plantibacter sp.]
MADTSPTVTLNDGHTIPQLGFGVYKVADDESTAVVGTALEVGYRHIDTASLYGNERGTGLAIRESGIPRDQLFVTTKVWNSDQGYEETLQAFDTSLELLGLDHVDLYLIHWPAPRQDRYRETWRALERLQAEGRTHSIGVSNFHRSHLERLLESAEVTPAVNQIELHPFLPQRELRAVNAEHGIATEAWSPLARGRFFTPSADGVDAASDLGAIAAKHDRSVAQVVLRWHLQLGNIVIPKSVTPARIAENFAVFDFVLDDDDIAAISALESGERTGTDPDTLD